jgi:UDPglucose 6-dehydrogenase
MKIAVIGLGFVGLSLASVLGSKNFNIIGIDTDLKKIEKIKKGTPPFIEPKLETTLKIGLKKKLKISSKFKDVESCDLIFVAVGTPQLSDGNIDLKNIKLVAKTLGKQYQNSTKKVIIIIKSTVIPGTTLEIIKILEKTSKRKHGRDFDVITNPEFLRESKAIEDTISPHLIVIGGETSNSLKKLLDFYRNMHPNIPIIKTNYQTAEMIKYANNAFLATKISFINQIASICEKIPGSNVEDIAKAIGLDPRIGELFLKAGPGYGGSCLPKDVKALINFSKNSGVEPILLKAVDTTNRLQIKKIERILEKILKNMQNKHIAILGVAFKANTDDIRDSISINLIKLLLKKGSKITIHDPMAIENTRKIFKNKIGYGNSIKNTLKNTNCAIIMTDSNIYQNILKNDFLTMKNKFVIDTRRILNHKNLDIEYHAIGLGKKRKF